MKKMCHHSHGSVKRRLDFFIVRGEKPCWEDVNKSSSMKKESFLSYGRNTSYLCGTHFLSSFYVSIFVVNVQISQYLCVYTYFFHSMCTPPFNHILYTYIRDTFLFNRKCFVDYFLRGDEQVSVEKWLRYE